MRGTGDQLITQDSYAVDSIRPKCIELQRMCDQYKSLLRRRREMLNKSHDLQDRIDKVRGQRFLRFQPTVGSSCIPVFLFYVNSVILPFRIKLNIRYKKSWASIFFVISYAVYRDIFTQTLFFALFSLFVSRQIQNNF